MQREVIRNLLIISGNGRKSGKTTAACKAISATASLVPVYAIKVSSHFHKPDENLTCVYSSEEYNIFEEGSYVSGKDSALMKKSGALKVFYIQSVKGSVYAAFKRTVSMIPEGAAVVCESQSLAESVRPGVFLLLTNNNYPLRKDVNYLRDYSDIEMSIEEISGEEVLPISFSDGLWQIGRK